MILILMLFEYDCIVVNFKRDGRFFLNKSGFYECICNICNKDVINEKLFILVLICFFIL